MHNRIYYLIISLALFLLAGVNSFAAFPAKGTWAYQTVASGTTVNVTLTDDVHLTGPIVIEKNAVLNITRAEKQDDGQTGLVRITLASNFTVPSGCKNCMFWVKEGGTLNIDGINQGYAIGLKASYNGSLPKPYENGTWKTKTEYEAELKTALAYTVAANNKKIHDYTGGGAIYAVGNVSLKGARIYDAYSSGEGAAIYRPMNDASLNYTYGTIALNNTRISQCVADFGPALLIYNQRSDKNGYGAANDDSSCKVTLSNLTRIFDCVSRGGSSGGAIRTGGGVVGDMELTLTEIYNNLAYGDGAGIYWNAHGDEAVDTRLTMKQCRVYENKALRNGGGLVLEATFEFLKGTPSGSDRFPNIYTDISDNIAEKNGGGIWCCTYNAVSGVGLQTLDFGLNENVQVLKNSAVCGGGVAYEMRDTTSLANNSTLNMTIDGAVIKNNTATAVGGGIYFRSNSSKLNTNLIIDGGTIQGNNATTYGGGIYAIKGPQLDVSKSMVKFNSGTISGNNATSGSGGGVAVFGLPIYCDADAAGITVNGNESYNSGGGIYVQNAQFTMNSGHVYGNKCLSESGEGGGIFCTDGSVINITGGMVGGEGESYANNSFNGAGIFVFDSDLIMNQGTVSYNKTVTPGGKSSNAGGIYVKGASSVEINDGTISNNTSGVYGGGIFVAACNSFLLDGGVVSYNETGTNGGGIFISRNSENVSITGGTIRDNKAAVHGGGLAVNANATVSGGEISGNSAEKGGGIYLWAETRDLVINGGEVSGNTSSGVGGGIYVEKGDLFVNDGKIQGNVAGGNGGGVNFNSGDGQFIISGGKIHGNQSSGHGGGIFVAACNSFLLDGGVVSYNETGTNGGGIFIHTNSNNVSISGGTIEGNTAGNGGGIATDAALTLNGGVVIKTNTARANGGGIYIGADMLVSMEGGEISGNRSGHRGGGIAVYYGNLSVDGGKILNNVAETICGGGVHLTPNASNTNKVTISNGVISGNSSTSGNGGGVSIVGGICEISGGSISDNRSIIGGGIYQSGGRLTITGGDIISNEARNGGGAFVTGIGVAMTFKNGIIRNNKAKDASNRTLTTGYDYTVSGTSLSLQGTGGGVFVQDGASLTISGDAVGIYGNHAETMADDIYSNGKSSAEVVLPDVSAMNLSGYNSKTSELYWVEDYMTGDTGYANGTAIGGAGHSAVRYRDAIAAQSTVNKVPAGTYTKKYLALSIGYEVIYVTLQRTGLQAGESAIYRIFRIDDGVPSVYSEVLLTGTAGAPVQSKRVALYSGKWRVEETLWTWTYVPPAAIERDITGSTDAQNKVFSFTAAKIESVPLHAEDIVVNDFGAGAAVTGSYVNSGSINDLQETTDYQLQ